MCTAKDPRCDRCEADPARRRLLYASSKRPARLVLVADAMTPGPVTVAPQATVAAARSAMRRGRFRHLLPVAAAELVGVLAHGDLAAPPGAPPEAAESAADCLVAEVMSGEPVTVGPDEPVEVAARLLVEHRIGCLPRWATTAVGILTESDLFTVLLRLPGVGEPPSRITLVLPDVPGALPGQHVVGDLGQPGRRWSPSPALSPAPWAPGRAAGRHHQRRLGGGRFQAAGFLWPPAWPACPVSGPAGLAVDDRLAAYDFGPDHPLPGRPAGRRPVAAAGGPGPGRRRPAGLRARRRCRPGADPRPRLPGGAGPLRRSWGGAPTWPRRPASLAGDNRPFPGMDEAGRLVAGATIAAVDTVAGGDLAHAFAPVAGLHHAQRRRVVGFCLVNDVAAAIARCTRAWSLRVLYVDLDAHHGDGVQAAFYDDPRVCTVSLHETGRYLFLAGRGPRAGPAAGVGRSVNAPWSRGPATTASRPPSTRWSSRWPPPSGPTCWSPRTAATVTPTTRSAISP